MFKRGITWWLCIRHKGKKIQKSLETGDKKLAKKIETKVRMEIIEGCYFDKPIGENKTIVEMMDRFSKEYSPRLSRNTQRAYRTVLNHLLPFFKAYALSDITPSLISGYKVQRNKDGASQATLNLELGMLSKAFSIAIKDWEWLRENPVLKVSKETANNKRDRWLSNDEEVTLLDNSPIWLRDLIIFALHTGLRQEELLSLEWPRVDLFRKTIVIQNTKNKKPKTVPLNQKALSVLMEKAKIRSLKSGFVFISRRGVKVQGTRVRYLFSSVTKKAGIKNFTWHDLRHTFATRMAQKGVDIYKISKLLGHADIKMTQRYAHHCPESLRDGVDILDKVDYNLTTIGENEAIAKG